MLSEVGQSAVPAQFLHLLPLMSQKMSMFTEKYLL